MSGVVALVAAAPRIACGSRMACAASGRPEGERLKKGLCLEVAVPSGYTSIG
jgi:hypothetical protein